MTGPPDQDPERPREPRQLRASWPRRGTAAPGRRRGRARHAAPVAVGRAAMVVRTLVGLVLTVAGVLLAVAPWGVQTSPSVPPGRVVAGAVLIAAGAVPVAELLIRGREELRAVAGDRPARTAPVAAVLSPVVVLAGCLWYRNRPPSASGPTAPVLVSVALLAVLVAVQGWGLGGLWRRPGSPPDGRPGSGPGERR